MIGQVLPDLVLNYDVINRDEKKNLNESTIMKPSAEKNFLPQFGIKLWNCQKPSKTSEVGIELPEKAEKHPPASKLDQSTKPSLRHPMCETSLMWEKEPIN